MLIVILYDHHKLTSAQRFETGALCITNHVDLGAGISDSSCHFVVSPTIQLVSFSTLISVGRAKWYIILLGRGATCSLSSSPASWRCRAAAADDVTAEWNTSCRAWVASYRTLRDARQCRTTPPARPADYTETERTTDAGISHSDCFKTVIIGGFGDCCFVSYVLHVGLFHCPKWECMQLKSASSNINSWENVHLYQHADSCQCWYELCTQRLNTCTW